ncbi:DUF4186 family protein [Streptomyces sp. NPDC018610]|uniref:DUF4186 domain-containing protein n=1 Tax=Streptomyces sp. NPDC018610 TaxID=3365049 RepID=UPI0037A41ADA
MVSSSDAPMPEPTPEPAAGPTRKPAAGPARHPSTGPARHPSTGPVGGPAAGSGTGTPRDPDADPDAVPAPAWLDRRLDAIGRQPFRARFHLRGRDRVTAETRGPATLRWHARDLITQRLAPAAPYKDGKQTPYRGHPVFVAQHATATCCRGCLERWHRIPQGRELSRAERAYVVEVICRWIEREVAGG